jgi:hypothetical protein
MYATAITRKLATMSCFCHVYVFHTGRQHAIATVHIARLHVLAPRNVVKTTPFESTTPPHSCTDHNHIVCLRAASPYHAGSTYPSACQIKLTGAGQKVDKSHHVEAKLDYTIPILVHLYPRSAKGNHHHEMGCYGETGSRTQNLLHSVSGTESQDAKKMSYR